jgi:hypothetical protein
MSAQHTPGPFRVLRLLEDDGTPYHLVLNAVGCPLARLQHCAEDVGNAQLFSAAAELLEALCSAEARLTLLIEREQHKLFDVIARDAARAAIAKATGGAA